MCDGTQETNFQLEELAELRSLFEATVGKTGELTRQQFYEVMVRHQSFQDTTSAAIGNLFDTFDSMWAVACMYVCGKEVSWSRHTCRVCVVCSSSRQKWRNRLQGVYNWHVEAHARQYPPKTHAAV